MNVVTRNEAFLNKCAMTIRRVNSAPSCHVVHLKRQTVKRISCHVVIFQRFVKKIMAHLDTWIRNTDGYIHGWIDKRMDGWIQN